MATVTLTFTDTPEHGVSVHSDFVPAAGRPLTPAMSAGLDTYVRACHQWGKPMKSLAVKLDATAIQIANYGSPAA